MKNDMNLIEYSEKEKILDSEMSIIWENPYLDGITDYEFFQKASVKILWVLKEPNGKGGGNQRVFHKEVFYYNRWKSTYGNIMRVSYGILNNANNYSDIPEIDSKECKIIDSIVLNEIAIININKSGGGSVTPFGKMANEYNRKGVKEYLFKQIEFINPDIIINSHDVKQFFLDLVGNNEINKHYGEQYSKNNNRIIIWTSHPNRAPKKSYCNNILKIVNEYK